MENLNYKKKSIIMALISGALVIAIFITTILLINSLNDNGERVLDNNNEIENKLYATVSESGKGFVKVDSIDEKESYIIETDDEYQKGDFIAVIYNKKDSNVIKPKEVEVIASSNEIEFKTTEKITEKTTMTTTTPTTVVNKTTKTTKKVNKTTTKKTTKTVNKASEADIIAYAKNENSNFDSYTKQKSIPQKAKSAFVTLVDFIFYDGEIKGVTFDELSNSAKAKVIYYTLLIDGKIDKKWPNYKETIKTKASDLKAKLIAKYMDLTSSICEKHGDECNQTKEDFALMKTSLNLTWDIVKSAFKYGYGKTTTYLKNWYEVWRNK